MHSKKTIIQILCGIVLLSLILFVQWQVRSAEKMLNESSRPETDTIKIEAGSQIFESQSQENKKDDLSRHMIEVDDGLSIPEEGDVQTEISGD